MSILESARIRLEPLRKEHAEAMFPGLSNPRLYEFIADDPPASLEVLREKYTRLESRRSPSGDDRWLNWIVFSKPALNSPVKNGTGSERNTTLGDNMTLPEGACPIFQQALTARGYVQATVCANTATIAYVLFESAWGQGLGRESVAMMMDHLRDAYAVDRFVAMIDTRNHRSIHLVKKLGFSLVKIHPATESVHGVLSDDAEYVFLPKR